MRKWKLLLFIVGIIGVAFVLSGCVTAPQPPQAPTYLYPSNGQTNVSTSTSLSWTDSGQNLTYNVYFGTSSSPQEVASNISGTSYTPSNLLYSTTYYWEIVAQNSNGETAPGPIESFTTEANPIPDITGSWNFTENIQGQVESMPILILQNEDNKNNVVMVAPLGNGASWNQGGTGLIGTITGNALNVAGNSDIGTGNLQGTLSNGVISGTMSVYDNNQQDNGTFQMTNQQALVVNQATDISGNWNFTINDQTTNQSFPTFITIYQDGSDVVAFITSTTLSPYGSALTLTGCALYGNVEGNSIDFTFGGLASSGGLQLSGNLLTTQSMSGTFQSGEDSGTWNAQFVSR